MHQRNANELSQEVQTLERHAAVLKSGLHDADRRTSDLQGKNKTLEGKLQALKSAAADNASEAVKAAEEMKCLQTSLMKSEEKVSCSDHKLLPESYIHSIRWTHEAPSTEESSV